MYQIATIIAAVQLAMDSQENNAVTAVIKHYLMDDQYVPREIRQEVLEKVNEHFVTKFSVTTIKKANPALLNGFKAQLPEKEKPVIVDSVKGVSEIPADSKLITDTATANNQSNEINEVIDMQQANQQAAGTTESNTATEAPTKPTKVTKQVNRAEVEAKVFAKALATAIEKGKVKKGNRHIILSFLEGDLTGGKVKGVYDYLKPVIKSLIGCLKEVPGLKTKEERESTFTAWIESDKAHTKSFKKFNKVLGDDIEKFDNKMALYLLTSEDNLKNAAALVAFALANPEKEPESSYSFMRENEGGVRGSWMAVGAAVVSAGVDMVQHGVSAGSILGGTLGTAAAFGLGTLIDEHVDDQIIRTGLCAGAGILTGAGGSRLGRAVIPGENYVDGIYSDETLEVVNVKPGTSVTVNVPAQAAKEEGGVLSGLASYLMG